MDAIEKDVAEIQRVLWKGNGQPGLVTQVSNIVTFGKSFIILFTLINLAIEFFRLVSK